MEEYFYYNELYLIYKKLIKEKNRDIFDLYYGENMTMQEIADLKNISKSRVGIIIKKTIEKLNQYENSLQIHHNNKILNEILELDDINKIKDLIKELIKGE